MTYSEFTFLSSLSDRDALSAILRMYTLCRDPEAAASALLDRFGSLKRVLESSPESLAKTVSRSVADKLASLMAVNHLMNQMQMVSRHLIANRKDLGHYALSLLGGLDHEEFYVICVDSNCRLLGSRRISSGSLSEVSAYPRMVVQAALDFNAHSVFFAHNHPGGTFNPSQEDVATTIQLKRALSALDILVLDHVIVAGADTYSMAQKGDLEFGARGR